MLIRERVCTWPPPMSGGIDICPEQRQLPTASWKASASAGSGLGAGMAGGVPGCVADCVPGCVVDCVAGCFVSCARADRASASTERVAIRIMCDLLVPRDLAPIAEGGELHRHAQSPAPDAPAHLTG